MVVACCFSWLGKGAGERVGHEGERKGRGEGGVGGDGEEGTGGGGRRRE